MRELRKFLVIFVLPVAQAEHARIAAAVKDHSDGECQIAFTWAAPKPDKSAVVAYLFTSEIHPGDMGFGLLNQDSFLLVELGDLCAEKGMNVAAAWMRRRRRQK